MNDVTPYVVEGQWDDAEWRRVAAKGAARTVIEESLYRQGPRQHPFGVLAYSVSQPDGQVFIFPSKSHAAAYMGLAASSTGKRSRVRNVRDA